MQGFFSRLLIIVFFLIPTIGFYCYDEWTAWYQAGVLLLLRLILLMTLFELIEIGSKKWLKYSFLVLAFPAFFADVLFLYSYKSLMSTSSTMALMNSTWEESSDFIHLYAWGMVAIILAYVGVSFVFIKNKYSVVKFGNKYFKVLSLFFIVVFVLIAENVFSVTVDDIGRDSKSFFKTRVVEHFPFNIYYRLYENKLYQQKAEQFRETVGSYKFNAQLDGIDKTDTLTVVLIIGETQRADLYLTEINKRKDKLPSFSGANLVPFPRMYATANSTAYCVPMILTRATVDQYDLRYTEPSLINLFNEAGYKTYWLANLNLFKGPETATYLENTDEFFPLWKQGKDDDVIVEYLKQVLQQPNPRKFIIINMKGNHFNYSYPEKYSIYQPNLESGNINTFSVNDKAAYLNSYLNTTVYQLDLLDQLHKLLDQYGTNSALFFSSDHGESLFEAPHYLFGHGSSVVPIEQLSCFSYYWLSNEYQMLFPAKAHNIKANCKHAVSADNIFYSIADLGAIRFDTNKPAYSISSDLFKEMDTLKVVVGNARHVFNVKDFEETRLQK